MSGKTKKSGLVGAAFVAATALAGIAGGAGVYYTEVKPLQETEAKLRHQLKHFQFVNDVGRLQGNIYNVARAAQRYCSKHAQLYIVNKDNAGENAFRSLNAYFERKLSGSEIGIEKVQNMLDELKKNDVTLIVKYGYKQPNEVEMQYFQDSKTLYVSLFGAELKDLLKFVDELRKREFDVGKGNALAYVSLKFEKDWVGQYVIGKVGAKAAFKTPYGGQKPVQLSKAPC